MPAYFRKKRGIGQGSPVQFTEVSRLILEPVPDLLEIVGVDKGKYKGAELKKILDRSRKKWR